MAWKKDFLVPLLGLGETSHLQDARPTFLDNVLSSWSEEKCIGINSWDAHSIVNMSMES